MATPIPIAAAIAHPAMHAPYPLEIALLTGERSDHLDPV